MSAAAGFDLAPDAAVDDGRRCWSRPELLAQSEALADRFRARGTRVVATLMDNSAAWVVADLAAAQAGVVHVPLPLFFSADQITHALAAAGVDSLLAPAIAASRWPKAPAEALVCADQQLVLVGLPVAPVPLPAQTAKITFTSGTTGAPKGVCLSAAGLRQVSAGLVAALAPLQVRRHLCALPFAVLLENVAGLMAPLAAGATCIAPPLAELGLSGSSGFDAARFQAAVERFEPNSIILLPQMLRAWAGHLQQTGARVPASLRLVAVGGAAVGARLIQAARAVGIPAYEGYGLSEGGSVQTLNLPSADYPGSAGRPLPHARVRLAGDGEIQIAGSLFVGYLGASEAPPRWWPTGDLGSFDAEGFLHVSGRKTNVLITAFGRNVSPEWVETALRAEPVVAQAVVLGETQPALSAVLWPVRPEVPDAALQAAVDAANVTLPDYARIHRWTRAEATFSAESGLATTNGRPRRGAVLRLHAEALGLAETSTT
ncbi:AMP-binding protein [Rivibacter subsaxonicus]|uniref:Long-subunit acyl-CoA synthetase (AMP-forming) n=1 Tax=Rivibacter subsaxonicus TaxID=457575 RepID=A0A4Q7VNH4_9BURK|nr:AMP-binding protein [Rivibacter subsaxonicus]RZT97862.1 long-subunit acyl-CoA synthetase (AMP-forming) [Rivibacter subsaxonicus]